MSDTRTDDEFRIDCLGPEPEAINHSSGFDGVNDDGYDFIASSDAGKMWRTLSGWGADGWDLGDWPFVIVQVAQEGTGDALAYLVRTRVEGDLDVWRFRTQKEAYAKIDHLAWWYWLRNGERYGLTREALGADVDRYRGPYSRTFRANFRPGDFRSERA